MQWFSNLWRRLGRAAVGCGMIGLLAALPALAARAAETPAIEQPVHPRCFTPQEMRTWYKPIGEIRVSPPPSPGQLPEDCSRSLFAPPSREAFRRAINYRCTFYWVASNMAHQPLYWDDQPLERYGQSVLPLAQPVLSGVHFFATFPLIPYQIGLDHLYDPIYTLGYYRPGDCAPPTLQSLPFQWDAAFLEVGTMTGLIFLAP
jgi:hypothetical protein